MRKLVEMNIYGHVQGVFFRAFVLDIAKNLDIVGFVENRPDNSVHIIAEGDERNLTKFIEKCKKGSQNSRVERVEIAWRIPTYTFSDFSIQF